MSRARTDGYYPDDLGRVPCTGTRSGLASPPAADEWDRYQEDARVFADVKAEVARIAAEGDDADELSVGRVVCLLNLGAVAPYTKTVATHLTKLRRHRTYKVPVTDVRGVVAADDLEVVAPERKAARRKRVCSLRQSPDSTPEQDHERCIAMNVDEAARACMVLVLEPERRERILTRYTDNKEKAA